MIYNGISVIVPIYKTPISVVNNFLKHIKYQTLSPDKFEVILVFDELRTDIGDLILPELKCDYKIIIQENSGTYEARRSGRRAAKMDIIFEADSDDFIPNKGLERVFTQMNLTEADLMGMTAFSEVTGELEYPPQSYEDCWDWSTYIKPVGLIYNKKVNEALLKLPARKHFIYSEDVVEMVYALLASVSYTSIKEHCYVYKDGGISNTHKELSFYREQMGICRNLIKDVIPKECLNNFDKLMTKLAGGINA